MGQLLQDLQELPDHLAFHLPQEALEDQEAPESQWGLEVPVLLSPQLDPGFWSKVLGPAMPRGSATGGPLWSRVLHSRWPAEVSRPRPERISRRDSIAGPAGLATVMAVSCGTAAARAGPAFWAGGAGV